MNVGTQVLAATHTPGLGGAKYRTVKMSVRIFETLLSRFRAWCSFDGYKKTKLRITFQTADVFLFSPRHGLPSLSEPTQADRFSA